MVELSTSYFGLELKNPIIASSSGISDNVENIKKLEESGVSAVVLKSLFEEEIMYSLERNMNKMNSDGFVYPETTNYFDYDEMDDPLMDYLTLVRDAKKAVTIPIIASVNCVSSIKWPFFSKQLEEAGADAIELNLFILPSDIDRNDQKTELIYFDIINEVMKNVSIPVSIKIGFYSSNLASLIQRLSRTGIAGITLFNRSYNPDFDITNFELTSAHVLSSPAEIAMPLRWISIMSDRTECDLAASTGVQSGDDVIKMILAGATAVQVASVVYKQGFQQIQKMIHEIEFWMEKNQFKSLSDYRGKMSQAKSMNPADYERVQFLKHFRAMMLE